LTPFHIETGLNFGGPIARAWFYRARLARPITPHILLKSAGIAPMETSSPKIMTALFILFVALFFLASVVFALGLRRATDGFEDETGFHGRDSLPVVRAHPARTVLRKRSSGPRFNRPGIVLKA